MYAVGKQMLLLFVLTALMVPLVAADGGPEQVSMDRLQDRAEDLQDLHPEDPEEVREAASAWLEKDGSDDAEDEAHDGSASSASGSDQEPSASGSEDDEGEHASGSQEPGPVATVHDQVVRSAGAAQDRATTEAAALTGLLDRHVQEVQEVDTDRLPIVLDLPSRSDEAPQETAPTSASASQIPITAAAVVVSTAAAAGATMVFFWLTGSSASSAGGAYASSKSASAAGKKFAPIFSPLFTRFEGKKVLEHPNREALYTHIAGEPGVRLQDLCDATGLSRTAVTHHLRLLENQHLVISKRVGRSRHYYENGGRFARDEKDAYAVLQNDRSKAIAAFIRSNPGAIQKHLCESLGVRPSIVHWHVKRLMEAQLVETVRQGRTVSYYPADAMARLAL